MSTRIHFLSDLHLSEDRPDITEAFVSRYLATLPEDVSNIYLLGDLFDTWVGDDDESDPIPEVRSALSQVAARGTHLYVIVGNRDFLLGAQFAKQFQVQLLPDFQVIDLFGTQTLLMHGDLLCTDDLTYQQFRAVSHSEEWQRNFLSQSLNTRKALVKSYREESASHKSNLPESIMDVNQDKVVETMQRYGVLRMIHGHTHRPAVHDFKIGDRPAQRFVLADWGQTGSVLEWTADGYQILTI